MQSTEQDFINVAYQQGFGNHFETEAKEGAIPKNQNSPVTLKYGLYAEQLSGTSFVVKRSENQRSWLYKIRPSVINGKFHPPQKEYKIVGSFNNQSQLQYHPNQLRWKKIPSLKEEEKKTFVEGLVSLAGCGQPSLKEGIAIYAYSANKSMQKECFYNSDGDFLIVPHQGTLYIKTLMGKLVVSPKQICVIPRGVNFTVECEGQIKGWVSQVFGHHFALPELGPIGSNGLAAPKDFMYPTAWFEDKQQEWKIINKYIGKIFEAKSKYSPFDVVGWRGNYSPYKYNLQLYNTIGSISFDHPDPSIFTVLTVKSAMQGTAALDFVVFPPRWLVAEHTFKPPFYHRNCMSEFMGNVCGSYDAKGQGFAPGCSSLHSSMTPHGPDSQSYQKFVKSEQKPFKIAQGNYSFMFESGYLLKTTKYAMNNFLETDDDYHKCWQKLSELKIEQK